MKDRAKIATIEYNDLDQLGSELIAVGRELSSVSVHGDTLINLGRTQLEILDLAREFAAKAKRDFLAPLQEILEQDAGALKVSA